jgi:hypothetical protein
LISTIIEHSKTKSKQKIVHDPFERASFLSGSPTDYTAGKPCPPSALINAAKADGQIDEDEIRRIEEMVGRPPT